MKRYVSILALLFFAAIFAAGCENRPKTEGKPPDNKTMETPKTETKGPPVLALTGVPTTSVKQKISVEGYQNDVDKAYLVNKTTGKTFSGKLSEDGRVIFENVALTKGENMLEATAENEDGSKDVENRAVIYNKDIDFESNLYFSGDYAP